MPSFRITLSIGALHAGVAPQNVLPAAMTAAGTLTAVEASDLTVVGGSPRITVRFTADSNPDAAAIAQHTIAATLGLADVTSWRLTRRDAGHWCPL